LLTLFLPFNSLLQRSFIPKKLTDTQFLAGVGFVAANFRMFSKFIVQKKIKNS